MSSFGVTVYDPGNEPIRPAHLDDCDNRAVLVQRKERSTQVIPLWHGALHRWFPATMVLRLAARPIASVMLSSNSVVGQRMAVSLGVELSNRFVDGAVEVIRTVERLMSEVMPLQVAPETLDVVQLRSIFRQPLDREPVGALGEGRP